MTYDNFFKHVGKLQESIYDELGSPHHRDAAREAVDNLCHDLDYDNVLEFGCGSAPVLSYMKTLGKRTIGVTLGTEQISHKVFRDDMHFSTVPSGYYDMVVMRHALEHSPIPLIMLMEVRRVMLRYALIIVPTETDRMMNWKNHYSVFPKKTWEYLFKHASLAVSRFEVANYLLNEHGKYDSEYRWLLTPV